MKKYLFFTISLIIGFSVRLDAQTIINSFTGNQTSTNIDFYWESATETNMDYFSLERSLDGINFTLVQNIDAVGFSNNTNNYSATDNYSFSDACYYYRLKATQFDGNSEFLDTIMVCYSSQAVSINEINANLITTVYPNPATSLLNVLVNGNEPVEMILFDCASRVVLKCNFQNSTTIHTEQFESGIYFYQITAKNGEVAPGKVIKQ